MQYLQPSFSVPMPNKVFGCEACIYGEQHGYPHTCVKPCRYGDPFCPCQDGDLCHYEGPGAWPPPRQSAD